MLSFLVGVLLTGALAFGFEPLFHTTPHALLAAYTELPQMDWLPAALDGVVYLGLALLLELILYKEKRFRHRASWGNLLVLVLWLLAQYGS